MTEYRTPTEDQVDAVLRRITNPQLRRAFFEGLKNPLWVAPLAKKGLFNHPPAPITTEAGEVRDVYWPEIEYLTRVAPDVPADVVDVLLQIDDSENAWVQRAVFEIGATIPPAEAARLKPLLKSMAAVGFGWRTDPRDQVSMVLNLLGGDEGKTGRWLADRLFRPVAAQGPNAGVSMDEYWYEDGLKRIAATLSGDYLSLVIGWLEEYERLSGHVSDTVDASFVYRGTIRSRDDDYPDVEQTLIDTVRDIALKAAVVEPGNAVNQLLKPKMALFRRIAMFAIGQVLATRSNDEASSERLLREASRLLEDPVSASNDNRIEYAELARAAASAAPGILDSLAEVILAGPDAADTSIREWIAEEGDSSADVDRRVTEYRERRLHQWLAAIGYDALPERARGILASLDERLGAIESPLEPAMRIISWSGPNSPMSQDEMAAMNATELVAHLESWHAGENWGPEPSHEGQGRELAALLSSRPLILIGIEGVAERLRPTYVRAILQGWMAALKAGLELDWDQTERLIAEVLAHGDDSPVVAEGGRFDDDPDFRGAKGAAVWLLEELVKQRDAPAVPADSLARFASLLVEAADDERAWLEYDSYEAENDMDALTISLNWQWAVRLRGLVNLLSHGADATWHTAALNAFRVEIGRDDRRGAGRAVLGASLGSLLTHDPDWLEPKVPELVGSAGGLSPSQQIALTTAMAIHRYHPKLYELLSPSMLGALRTTGPIVSGWRGQTDPKARIGEWVIDALIRGHRTLDDSVATAFFTTAPPPVRGEAIGHIAWAFMHAEAVDDEIRDRFARLWDQRVAHVRMNPEDREELNGFHWFVKSKKFPETWWLPRLKEAVELNPQLLDQRLMIGKEVAAASNADPRNALEVLRVFLSGPIEAATAAWDLSRNAVPIVLARGMVSGDPALAQEATDLMHELGEKGDLELRRRVDAVLAGDITQADVD